MSLRLMSAVWDLQTESHTQKLVLLALADNANDEGVCWPSIATIAKKCNLTKRSVQLQIRKLEKGRLLKVKSEPFRSNTYHLTVLLTGESYSPGGERHSPGGVNRIHPNHQLEPSGNQEREEKRVSLAPASQPEKEKRQRECHRAYVESTGRECRYDLHSKLWKAFDDAGYSAQDVRSVIQAKKAWNSKRPDCPKNLSIEKLIGNLAKFDEELAKVKAFHRPPRDCRRNIIIESKPIQLPPAEEFKAGLAAMRKAL